MVQIIDGEITLYTLPKVGTLKDGRTVSGYHLLDEEILKDEGWLPLEDIPPEYDKEIQYLISDGYEILEDKVIKKYRVEDIAEEIELANKDKPTSQEQVNTLLKTVSDLQMEIMMLKMGDK